MARPGSRSRRVREEEEEYEDDRRGGRTSARRPPAVPPLAIAGLALLAAGGVALLLAGGEKKKAPKPKALAPAPPPKAAEPPPPPPPPAKIPPKPLTPEERAWIESLFQKAEPHVVTFRAKAKEGWALKEKGDNEGANDAWVKAKEEAHLAIAIVGEALEDYDKFPPDRQEVHMQFWNGRLSSWQKEMGNLPKVHVEK